MMMKFEPETIIDPYGRVIKESCAIDDDIVIADLELDYCLPRMAVAG